MKILKRNDKGKPIEVLLTDDEVPLKMWYDHLRSERGLNRRDAWTEMYYHQNTTAKQKNLLYRDNFYDFLIIYS